MEFNQVAIVSLILIMLLMFVWNKWRYDIVAVAGLVAAVLLNLVPANQMFLGFGHPATITVAFVLILSYGLTKSGAIEGVIKFISPISNTPAVHVAALIFISAFFSMFMNNVGALAILMPVAIESTVKAGRKPATVLMPLSFGSILGGLATLIGTPPNIIISSYREQVIGEPYKMFDFLPLGGTIAIAGILFMSLIGWRLVKVRKSSAGLELFEIEAYLFEAKISAKSPLIDITVAEFEKILEKFNTSLVLLIHKKQRYPIAPRQHQFCENDLLGLEGPQKQIDKLVSKYKLKLLAADSAREEILHSNATILKELVVTPGSKLEGKSVERIRFKYSLGVNLLAVSRQGKPYRGRLRNFKFNAGDVLLLHGVQDDVEEAVTKLNCYPLAKRKIDFGKRRLRLIALGLFILAIVFASLGYLKLEVCLAIAILGMILTNIIPVRELYDGIDWSIIVLLAAMIPIGNALQSTGTTTLIAENLGSLLGHYPPIVIVAIILIITMTLSDVLNNAATAILMAPIAYNISLALKVSPDPLLMAVAIGASSAFLTPIGHQNNALVLGPGGYHFGDFWRMGLPLEILIVTIVIFTINIIWPFYP